METGLYIHIPFCERKCRYCAFYSITNSDLVADYCEAVVKEAEFYKDNFENDIFSTLYIGGGTPSILPLNDFEKMVSGLRSNLNFGSNIEFTVEVNPKTITSDKVKLYKKLGVDRISVGIQSFNENELKFLGRIHKPDEGHTCLDLLDISAIDNVSIDIIYGIPGQKLGSLGDTLKEAMKHKITHISAYNLQYEAGTPLYDNLQKGMFKKIPYMTEEFMYFYLVNYLKENGYQHYELSSFAIQDIFRSKHNLFYWQGKPYLGLGASSHSYSILKGKEHKRWGNIEDIRKYIYSIKSGCPVKAFEETLDHDNQVKEFIMLRLRLIDGFSVSEFEDKFGKQSGEELLSTLCFFFQNGLLEEVGGMISIPGKKLFVSNEILTMLFSKL